MIGDHSLQLSHRRSALIRAANQYYADSEVEVSAHSEDLVECWKELLSRLPNDVYGALKEAMSDIEIAPAIIRGESEEYLSGSG